MTELLIQWMPWGLSAITIYMTVLAGNKTRWAWLVGLLNQAFWLAWIVLSSTWGLLPMNLALWIVYARNHLKWREEGKAEDPLREIREQMSGWSEEDRLIAEYGDTPEAIDNIRRALREAHHETD